MCVIELGHFGSVDGLSPVSPQTIKWTKGNIMTIWFSSKKLGEIWIYIYVWRYAFENLVCEMPPILPEHQCGNQTITPDPTSDARFELS